MPILYRPFDVRWTVYDRNVAVHRRERAFDNFVGRKNVGLAMMRQASADQGYTHVLAIDHIADNRAQFSNRGVMAASPLWLYPQRPADLLDLSPSEKTPNLANEFGVALAESIGQPPLPEDTFAYLYAVLYTPSYRNRYADFLKRDFPRVPLTRDRTLFERLLGIGRELIALHTMQTILPRITRYDVAGSNEVVKVRFAVAASPSQPSSSLANGKEAGRVYVNDAQYFDGVSQAVWDSHIGGYRVAEKWLKDRKGRLLRYDDITHYQAVIAALARTLELQAELDGAVEAAGGWPLN